MVLFAILIGILMVLQHAEQRYLVAHTGLAHMAHAQPSLDHARKRKRSKEIAVCLCYQADDGAAFVVRMEVQGASFDQVAIHNSVKVAVEDHLCGEVVS